MTALLRVSHGIDELNRRFGWIASWLILLACLISAGNATSRYLFSLSSNAWLEVQWYMFAGMFLLGASYTLRMNGHVRVDLIYANVSPRMRLWIDTFGLLLFLMPAMVMLAWMSWPYFVDSWVRMEHSSNAGGLIRWPVKLLMPLGFALVSLQGISELIKRIAALTGHLDLDTGYERPLQ